jgi:hypothetical protein
MTPMQSLLLSLPFLFSMYSSVIFFIIQNQQQYITDDDDTESDDDSDDEHDEETSNSIKFNRDYEKKYIDKLKIVKNEKDIKKEYEFTEEEKLLVVGKIEELKKDINSNNNNNNTNETEEITKKAEEHVMNKRWERLMNSYVLENTPLGNVLMRYNVNTEVFEFYSDSTIPYRYLEAVARKYVLTNNCIPLYIDMEETLKESEQKMLDQEAKDKQEKENNSEKKDTKKSVFANLKDYNKPSFSSSVKNIPPPKNSVSNIRIDNTNEDKKVLLKEKANRYSYQGKIANCNFIKKVDKKLVNKRYGLSFADFKKKIVEK